MKPPSKRSEVKTIKKLWISKLDTRNFSFMAIGETREQAEYAMVETWKKHCESHDDTDPWEEFEDSMNTYEVVVGSGYKVDGEAFELHKEERFTVEHHWLAYIEGVDREEALNIATQQFLDDYGLVAYGEELRESMKVRV